MKGLLAALIVISILLTGTAALAEGPGGGRGGRGGMGGINKSDDAELQTMIAETAPKFQLMAYEDAETGTSLLGCLFC